MSILIRPETERDFDAIRQINHSAFGGEDEGRLVDSLRDEGYVRVSLVAECDQQVVGHILFSDLTIVTSSQEVRALALAPMAVLPEYQRQGIGSELVRQGMQACRDQGHQIVIVLGHPEFYPRFGFYPELTRQLESPYAGEAFMAAELVAGALTGITGQVQYAPPFERLG